MEPVREIDGTDLVSMGRLRVLIPGLMCTPVVGVLASEPGVGKTLLLLDLALAIVTGRDWLGHYATTGQRNVVFVSADSEKAEIAGQWRGLLAGYGIGEYEVGNFTFLDYARRGLDIMQDEAFDNIVEHAKGYGAPLVIIDALSDCHLGDENDRVWMSKIFRRLRLLADKTDATVLCAHHTAKVRGVQTKTFYVGRGSSIIEAKAGWVGILNWQRDGVRKLWITKARGVSAAGETLTYRLAVQDHNEERSVRLELVEAIEQEARIDRRSEAYALVLAQVRSGVGLRRELAAAVQAKGFAFGDKAYYVVSNALQELRKRGEVEQEGRGVWKACKGEES